uniref:Dimer_Tnp_hAT domain-containing protein n=1 Tax=Caenorhabditis japonica TaxID=281687 RepID=A0A8R1HN00_CAEJA
MYANYDCFAHKLNLAVKAGIEVFDTLSVILCKLRKICNIINKSGNARREYDEISTSLGIPPLALKKNIEVRWNTVHAVFERALKVRDVIDFLSNEHADWPKLSSTDWNTAKSVVQILQPIVDSTILIQARGMTSSAIIPLCKVLIGELKTSHVFRNFCSSMIYKLEEELAKYEKIEYLQFGTMLDIRFKDNFTNEDWKEKLLEKLYVDSDLDLENTLATSDQLSPKVDNPFSRFMKTKTPDQPRRNKPGSLRDIIALQGNGPNLTWYFEMKPI